MVLGITNTHIDAQKYRKMNQLDYLKMSGQGLDAIYHSASSEYSIKHDGAQWNVINDENQEIVASIQSTNVFPNAIAKDLDWKLSNGKTAKYLSVHCEVLEKKHYYQNLRDKFQVCHVNADGSQCGNRDDFKNEHFDTVVLKDTNEWKFGITNDLKYFTWNETDGKSHKIPSVGIGTAGINNDRDVIQWAVNKYKYELIDSASDHAPWYQNEHIIGDLLNKKVLQRDAFMVTTKLYAKDQGLYGAKHGLDDSLKNLDVDFIDIYLIHHLHCDNELCEGSWKTSWRVIEDYYFANKIKYVGVSNVDINQFHELLDWTNIPIAVIQNWFDPFHTSDEGNIVEESKRLSIVYQAYSLLGTQWKYIGNGYKGNKDPVFSNPKLQKIADKYDGKSIAQIVLRWALQKKIGILPSSSKEQRIKQNMDIFDFELDAEDMMIINGLV